MREDTVTRFGIFAKLFPVKMMDNAGIKGIWKILETPETQWNLENVFANQVNCMPRKYIHFFVPTFEESDGILVLGWFFSPDKFPF